jgi:hypothetical protein
MPAAQSSAVCTRDNLAVGTCSMLPLTRADERCSAVQPYSNWACRDAAFQDPDRARWGNAFGPGARCLLGGSTPWSRRDAGGRLEFTQERAVPGCFAVGCNASGALHATIDGVRVDCPEGQTVNLPDVPGKRCSGGVSAGCADVLCNNPALTCTPRRLALQSRQARPMSACNSRVCVAALSARLQRHGLLQQRRCLSLLARLRGARLRHARAVMHPCVTPAPHPAMAKHAQRRAHALGVQAPWFAGRSPGVATPQRDAHLTCSAASCQRRGRRWLSRPRRWSCAWARRCTCAYSPPVATRKSRGSATARRSLKITTGSRTTHSGALGCARRLAEPRASSGMQRRLRCIASHTPNNSLALRSAPPLLRAHMLGVLATTCVAPSLLLSGSCVALVVCAADAACCLRRCTQHCCRARAGPRRLPRRHPARTVWRGSREHSRRHRHFRGAQSLLLQRRCASRARI